MWKPPKKGNAEWLLRNFLDLCESKGHITQAIFLSETPLELCNGSIPEEPEAAYQDSMEDIGQKMLEADLLVFASPTYFDHITPQLQNFLDRTDPFYENLKGKGAVFLLVGQAHESSQQTALGYMRTYAEIAELEEKGALTFRAACRGEVEEREDIAKKIKALVERMEL